MNNPFSNLDRNTRKKTIESICDTVFEKDLTILFTTDDYYEVFGFADNVAILSDGRLLQICEPKEVYKNPNTKAVSEVVGDNNLMSARLIETSTSDVYEFISRDGEAYVQLQIP